MPKISVTVDKDAWDSQFVVLPPGEYIAVHELPTPETSSKKGTPGIKLKMKIESPETVTIDGKEHRITNQRIFDDIWLVPAAAGILRQKLAGSGVPFTLAGDQVDFDYADFQGKRVKVKLGIEKNPETGAERNKVQGLTPA